MIATAILQTQEGFDEVKSILTSLKNEEPRVSYRCPLRQLKNTLVRTKTSSDAFQMLLLQRNQHEYEILLTSGYISRKCKTFVNELTHFIESFEVARLFQIPMKRYRMVYFIREAQSIKDHMDDLLDAIIENQLL